MHSTDPQSLMRQYRMTRDPRVRDAIVTRFLPLARSLARRYGAGAEPLEDLEQVAALALVKAVDGFDPARGTAFSSYAVPCIAGAIKRHFRDYGWSVRVPRELQELAMPSTRSTNELRQRDRRAPDRGPDRPARRVADPGGGARGARGLPRAARDSLDASRPTRDGEPRVAARHARRPPRRLPPALDRVALDSLLDELDERDRAIVRLYYREELTQSQIGERLGYSQMHISRLLRRAVGELEKAAA